MWVFNSRQNSLQKQCFQTVPFTRENHPKHTKLNRNVEFYTKARSDSFPNDFHLKAKIIVICTISPLNEKKKPIYIRIFKYKITNDWGTEHISILRLLLCSQGQKSLQPRKTKRNKGEDNCNFLKFLNIRNLCSSISCT